MGLYEGGMVLTLIYITIISLFVVGGIYSPSDPQVSGILNCVPNDQGFGQYGGTDTNANCSNIQTPNGINVSTTEKQTGGGSLLGTLTALIPGGQSLIETVTFIFAILSHLLTGWIFILTTIFGGGQLSILIWVIGLPLQILQIYFLFQVSATVLSAIAGVIGSVLR